MDKSFRQLANISVVETNRQIRHIVTIIYLTHKAHDKKDFTSQSLKNSVFGRLVRKLTPFRWHLLCSSLLPLNWFNDAKSHLSLSYKWQYLYNEIIYEQIYTITWMIFYRFLNGIPEHGDVLGVRGLAERELSWFQREKSRNIIEKILNLDTLKWQILL